MIACCLRSADEGEETNVFNERILIISHAITNVLWVTNEAAERVVNRALLQKSRVNRFNDTGTYAGG